NAASTSIHTDDRERSTNGIGIALGGDGHERIHDREGIRAQPRFRMLRHVLANTLRISLGPYLSLIDRFWPVDRFHNWLPRNRDPGWQQINPSHIHLRKASFSMLSTGNFKATSRPSLVSVARYTTPMAPAPSFETIRYCAVRGAWAVASSH